MRLVFMGTSEFSKIALDAFRESKHSHEIVMVVSQPAKPQGRKKELLQSSVSSYAKQHGLLLREPERAVTRCFLEELRHVQPDVIITASYGQILSEEFLSIPKRATINIHPSLLPQYRGATPIPAALLHGETSTGVSILFTVKKLDAGPIILQERTTIDRQETQDQLCRRLFRRGGELLPLALEELLDREFLGSKQEDCQATYAGKIKKADGVVDWSWSAESIYNQYRAYHPWPGIFTYFSEGLVKLVGVQGISDNTNSLKIGEFFFEKLNKILYIGTKNKCLNVAVLQRSGRKPQKASEFWNGLKTKNRVQFNLVRKKSHDHL